MDQSDIWVSKCTEGQGGGGPPPKFFSLNFTNFFLLGASLIVHELNENTYSSLMFCSGRAKAFRVAILRFLGLLGGGS